MEGSRGNLVYPELANKVIDFGDIRYGKATGTDFDYFLELGDIVYIFIEYKSRNGIDVPGQSKAFMRLTEALKGTGRHPLLIWALDNNYNSIGQMEVIRYKTDNKVQWYRPQIKITCKQLCDYFVGTHLLHRLNDDPDAYANYYSATEANIAI